MDRRAEETRVRRFLKRLSPQLLWDGFMVYLAIVNMGLILFDMTYFWMRPIYLQTVPWVPRHYDQVKGILPHPVTERYLAAVDTLEVAVEDNLAAAAEADLAELRILSRQMLIEDPFAVSREGDLEAVKFWVLEALGADPTTAAVRAATEAAFDEFWSWDPTALPARLDLFDAEIRPVMEANFFRQFDPARGRYKDMFWLIDLPFLLLFAGEFAVRWWLALRRHSYPRWYHFPVFNWYDLLGLIPYTRIFRLFRIASIYVRLHRSELSSVGDDFISQSVKWVARAISEEISDLVTIRILSQAQAKISQGVYSEVIRDTILKRRDALRESLVGTIYRVLDDPELRENTRRFLVLNLDESVDSARSLQGIPLPDRVLRPLVRGLGAAVYDSLLDTLTGTLGAEEGRESLELVVDEILEEVLKELAGGELEEIVVEIAYEALARTKADVAVREWAGERESLLGGADSSTDSEIEPAGTEPD